MNIELKKINGKYTFNGKSIKDLNPCESIALDNLIIEARLENLDIKGEIEVKQLPDWEKLLES